MSYNNEIKKRRINEVTRELFAEAVRLCFRDGIKERAPLGYRGDTIMLFGESRRSEVSVFNHSGDAKMLITDSAGRFLFYGGFHLGFGVDFIANHYYNIFCLVEQNIEGTAPENAAISFHLHNL